MRSDLDKHSLESAMKVSFVLTTAQAGFRCLAEEMIDTIHGLNPGKQSSIQSGYTGTGRFEQFTVGAAPRMGFPGARE